jgi:hypothetical protein
MELKDEMESVFSADIKAKSELPRALEDRWMCRFLSPHEQRPVRGDPDGKRHLAAAASLTATLIFALATQTGFEKYGRKRKREQFLDEMNGVVPWSELLALIQPFCPRARNGRRPVGLEIMLRVCFVPQWLNPSDPGVEDALYD